MFRKMFMPFLLSLVLFNVCTSSSYGDCEGEYKCLGNAFLMGTPPPVYAILSKEYHFNDLKLLASGGNIDVLLEQNFTYVNYWRLSDFEKHYKITNDVKPGDNIVIGKVIANVKADKYNYVTINGPRIVIRKRVSYDESYEITIQYEPDKYVKQSITVIQNGKCDFTESHLRIQVESVLNKLAIDSTWLKNAVIVKNTCVPTGNLP